MPLERSLPAADARPEHDLLISCARTFAGSRNPSPLKGLLTRGIEWPYCLQAALRHKVMPLVCRCLSSTCPELVPEAALKELRDQFHENARRNLLLTGALFNVLGVLDSRGIPAIPFKGPVLSAFLYGDVTMRQCGDLDFLLRREDIPKARDALRSIGYGPERMLTPGQERAFLRSDCELTLVHDRSGGVVEIHWRLMPGYFPLTFDFAELWDRCVEAVVEGKAVPTLSREDLLMVLCVHGGGKHRWERLGWVCDVTRAINMGGGLNMARVVARARELGMLRLLSLGLIMAREVCGARLPDDILREVYHDGAARAMAGRLRARLFFQNRPGRDIAAYIMFQLRTMERLRDRARYCLRRAMDPSREDWELLPLPAALSSLYYPIRPIRLLAKNGLRLMRRLAGRRAA